MAIESTKVAPKRVVTSPVLRASETLYFCCRREKVLSPSRVTSQTRLTIHKANEKIVEFCTHRFVPPRSRARNVLGYSVRCNNMWGNPHTPFRSHLAHHLRRSDYLTIRSGTKHNLEAGKRASSPWDDHNWTNHRKFLIEMFE